MAAALFSAPDVLREYVSPAMTNRLVADCSVYATANGLANMALNRDKVGQFVQGSRMMYKGWLHGYERAACLTGSRLVQMASSGAKSTLGPSVVYGVSMRIATTALGLPSLVAVGGANVITPVIVNKVGGSLANFSTSSLAARAFPIAAHCVIEWGLYGKMKEHLESRGGGGGQHASDAAGTRVPRTRMSMVMEGALVGGASAAVATAATVFALSPWYGGKLLSRAFAADSAAVTAKLSMAAVRVTGIRLADSLQQGVVWFSTYEGMRAAMAIYDKKAAEEAAEEEANAEEKKEIPTKLSVSVDDLAAGEVGGSGAASLEAPVSPGSPRFSRKHRMSSPTASGRLSMSRTSSSSSDFQSPRRFSLAGC